jgi:glucose-1-phosphate thymidylyltransferase
MARKGIILAGGDGSRLRPLTLAVSKQLLPVYDKPLVYYPLATLMLAGVREILVIVDPTSADQFHKLLGDGSQWGASISYAIQSAPKGVADAMIIAEDFLGGESSVLILGDNIFFGVGLGRGLLSAVRDTGATATVTHVDDPTEFGVIEFGTNMQVLSIEEKPADPKSNFAIAGLYFFDGSAPARAKSISPSSRGELEITDLLNTYLEEDLLTTIMLPRGDTWLDAGSIDGLVGAGELIKTLQTTTGQLVGSPSEAAWRQGWISERQLLAIAGGIKSDYGRMLERAVEEERKHKSYGS